MIVYGQSQNLWFDNLLDTNRWFDHQDHLKWTWTNQLYLFLCPLRSQACLKNKYVKEDMVNCVEFSV